jgi:hypothetical protein
MKMTEAQHHLYIRRWICVVRANHWVMRKSRLVDNAIGVSAPASGVSEYHAAVWTAAEQLALQQHRAVTADDLRKGCHVVATGIAKSSWDLTNKEFNRLLVLWGNERPRHEGGMAGLLIDSEDLASIAAWNNPDVTERNSFVAFLRSKAHEGLLITIAENAFQEVRSQEKSWDELDLSKLRWMSKQLKDRKPPRHQERQVYETDRNKVPY